MNFHFYENGISTRHVITHLCTYFLFYVLQAAAKWLDNSNTESSVKIADTFPTLKLQTCLTEIYYQKSGNILNVLFKITVKTKNNQTVKIHTLSLDMLYTVCIHSIATWKEKKEKKKRKKEFFLLFPHSLLFPGNGHLVCPLWVCMYGSTEVGATKRTPIPS